MKITIGADPEVFIRSKTTQKFVSAQIKGHQVVPGTKQVPFITPFGACQVDGVALEFNINPALNCDSFVKSVGDGLRFLSSTMHKELPDCDLAILPTATFDQDYFESLPKEAQELGCEPDFNAYTKEANPKPETTEPFRTASGHIHIGWTDGADPYSASHQENCREITKQLDISLFIPSLLFDSDSKRRRLYGAPGAYRPKPYGVEYRVLSNRWLQSEVLQRWVFNRTLKSVKDLIKRNIKYEDVVSPTTLRYFLDSYHDPATKHFSVEAASAYPSIIQLPEAA